MKKKFSKAWKSSKAPKKQRKYLANAPLHIRKNFMSAHLSKELIKTYNRRSLPVRKGDIVKVLRGNFKNKTGKVESVNIKRIKVYIDTIQEVKKDGTKYFHPIHPSNLLIMTLDLEDKQRKKVLERTKK